MTILLRVILVLAAMAAVGLGLLFGMSFFAADTVMQEQAAAAAAGASFLFAIGCVLVILMSYVSEAVEILHDMNKRDNAWVQWQYKRANQQQQAQHQPVVMPPGQLNRDQ